MQNSNPYYRSTYALIYKADRGLTLKSIDDPILQTLKIGAIAGTPPTTILATQGLLGNLRSYQLLVDTRFDHPAAQIGPRCRHRHDRYRHALGTDRRLLREAGVAAACRGRRWKARTGPMQMDFRITMGMRHNEPEWKRKINGLIRKQQAEINKILLGYGVPLLDDKGKPMTQ